jgi:branched-chain amino acid transport system ATP-binding protein
MLEVQDLQVNYGAAPAIWDVSLKVEQGELVCVVGPNGAGKSTLINVIAGLHRARAGQLRFNGQDVTQLASHLFCARGIAIVPEGRRLFTGMTVRDNLELGSYLPGAKAARAQSMEQVLSLFPVMKEKLEAPAGALSGGQQQMVAVGRALMGRPDLLAVDELSLGLAPKVVADLVRHLRELHRDRGLAVLLIEQNARLALDLCARAYVLEAGRVVTAGPSADLAADPRVVAAYLGGPVQAETPS